MKLLKLLFLCLFSSKQVSEAVNTATDCEDFDNKLFAREVSCGK